LLKTLQRSESDSNFITTKSPAWFCGYTRRRHQRPLELCKKIKKLKEEISIPSLLLIDNNQTIEQQLEWFDLGVDELGYAKPVRFWFPVGYKSFLAASWAPIRMPYPQRVLSLTENAYLVYKDGQDIFLPS
jgi:hypothetical protein